MIQYFDFDNYNLSSGKVLEKVRLAYTTEGELSANKDNAILVFHALTGSHMLSGDFKKPENIEIPWNDEMTKGWWTDFVGPKKMFDTEKYFDVFVVPVRYSFGNQSYIDKVSQSVIDFYNELESNPIHPKTSQPTPGDFRRQYQYLNLSLIHI